MKQNSQITEIHPGQAMLHSEEPSVGICLEVSAYMWLKKRARK